MTPQQNTTLELEWHSILNGEKTLQEYTKGSRFKAWWKCSICSFEWEATIANRVIRKSKCPSCKKINGRGSKNSRWNGFGEISGKTWATIKKEALRKNQPLEITIQDTWNLFLKQDGKCNLTGKKLIPIGKRNGKYSGNACLDKIDSTKGFTPNNLQWIDKDIQSIKRNVLTNKEFLLMCESVAKYQASKVTVPSFKTWASLK